MPFTHRSARPNGASLRALRDPRHRADGHQADEPVHGEVPVPDHRPGTSLSWRQPRNRLGRFDGVRVNVDEGAPATSPAAPPFARAVLYAQMKDQTPK